jgi:tRNA-specific adenosine deaminase 3
VSYSLIRNLIPNDGGLDLQHLRRFAKSEHVPEHVRIAFSAARTNANLSDDNHALTNLYLVVGSTNALPEQTLIESLSATINDLTICSIQVPLLTPTSKEQATLWSSKYWPTVYKKSNPFGPHPSIVSRAEEEMRGDTTRWLDLAAAVAQEARTIGCGEAVGVVIVERRDGTARPVAIAGDARWLDWPHGESGNVIAHAALRAIALVAGGLKARDEAEQDQQKSSATTMEEGDIFRDKPLLALEKEYCDPSGNENGYLCHELEIYCTHEPCVMCSMAIVHSRFGRVIFEKRMPATGGLCADGGLGHGLFWRKELNWTLLAWQWLRSNQLRGDGKGTVINSDLNA